MNSSTIEPVVDDLRLRLAYAAGDWKAYGRGCILLGVSFASDSGETLIGQAAADAWADWADLLPWER